MAASSAVVDDGVPKVRGLTGAGRGALVDARAGRVGAEGVVGDGAGWPVGGVAVCGSVRAAGVGTAGVVLGSRAGAGVATDTSGGGASPAAGADAAVATASGCVGGDAGDRRNRKARSAAAAATAAIAPGTR